MENSENLNLPYIMPAQAQKHVTHNEAIRMLDAIVQIGVLGIMTQPPQNPANGDRYIIETGAIGDWSGKDNYLAAFQDGAWMVYPPQSGWMIFNGASEQQLVYRNGAWADLPAPLIQQNLDQVGINATADNTNRLSIASPACLFSHDGSDHRLTVNKQSEQDTASIMFQNNWTGHAEFGLTGNNNTHIKVSPDGQNWNEAIQIDKQTGNIGIHTQPTETFSVSGGMVRIGQNLISASESSGGAAMEVMGAGSGDRHAYFDFHACDEHADYSARFIRWQGQNSPFSIYNRGLGGIDFTTEHNSSIRFNTNSIERMRVSENGNIGIGTQTPETLLDVEGIMRLAPKTIASLPTPTTAITGAIAYVSDKPGGAGLMTCDGVSWN